MCNKSGYLRMRVPCVISSITVYEMKADYMVESANLLEDILTHHI